MIGSDIRDYVHANDRQLLLDYCNTVQSSAVAESQFSSSWSAHCSGQWSVVSLGISKAITRNLFRGHFSSIYMRSHGSAEVLVHPRARTPSSIAPF